jgi:sporulation protein YlmC with PRC-barrel domain
MSETFRGAVGRKAVSRASAEELGNVSRLVVDVEHKAVAALVLGKGRKARLVDWAALSGFGPDAVIVADDGALRSPADDADKAAVAGALELVGKRALSDRGNEIGKIEDVTFDPATGELELVIAGGQERPAEDMLANGSYAAVFRQDQS